MDVIITLNRQDPAGENTQIPAAVSHRLTRDMAHLRNLSPREHAAIHSRTGNELRGHSH